MKTNKCIQVIKSGANKGKQCGCDIFKDNICKRHYNLINNNDKNIKKDEIIT